MPDFRNPTPTVDVFVVAGSPDKPVLVLIRRKNPPHGLAFPGGFVNEGESCEQAAVRELQEETGLHVTLTEQFHTYSKPNRDPRKHIMTTVFVGTAIGQMPQAGDDAAEIVTVPFDVGSTNVVVGEPMAFDHAIILADILHFLRTGFRPKLTV